MSRYCTGQCYNIVIPLTPDMASPHSRKGHTCLVKVLSSVLYGGDHSLSTLASELYAALSQNWVAAPHYCLLNPAQELPQQPTWLSGNSHCPPRPFSHTPASVLCCSPVTQTVLASASATLLFRSTAVIRVAHHGDIVELSGAACSVQGT